VRNTLFTHATLYPEIWYGIWSGPDSYNGPDHERAGEADAHLATALTDYPVLNAHVHVGPIRALLAVLGVEATPLGYAVRPRVPTERWTVRFPRLWLDHAPDRVSGRAFASADAPLELTVQIPAALRGARIVVTVAGSTVPHTIVGDDAVFVVPALAGAGVDWAIAAR
jgi:hypothetical protein